MTASELIDAGRTSEADIRAASLTPDAASEVRAARKAAAASAWTAGKVAETRRQRGRVVDATTPEQAADIEAAFAACHEALLAAGATLDNESDWGSRYYTLAGVAVRVADHEATDATRHWLDGRDSREVRVDKRGWRGALEAACGRD